MTFLGTSPRVCFASDAILWIGDRHDLVAHIVAVLVLALEGLLYELQDIPAAHLVTVPATDAFLIIDRFQESGVQVCPPLVYPIICVVVIICAPRY